MDIELINIIKYIQTIKYDTYKKYKPELIDAKPIITNQYNGDYHERTLESPSTSAQAQPERSSAYLSLLRRQRQIVYATDFSEHEKAIQRNQMEAIQLNNTTLESPVVKSSHHNIYKPWSKVPNNSKIQLLLNFIESLQPQPSDEDKRKLKYLLISSISNKKLIKSSDVNYDDKRGVILDIPSISYQNQEFILIDDNHQRVFPFRIIERTECSKMEESSTHPQDRDQTREQDQDRNPDPDLDSDPTSSGNSISSNSKKIKLKIKAQILKK
ncbi:MAG: hypothetical protein ABIN35_00425 [candidate division WOR-3 bacterium]